MGQWDQMDQMEENLGVREDQEGLEGQGDQVVEDPLRKVADREEIASDPVDESAGDES